MKEVFSPKYQEMEVKLRVGAGIIEEGLKLFSEALAQYRDSTTLDLTKLDMPGLNSAHKLIAHGHWVLSTGMSTFSAMFGTNDADKPTYTKELALKVICENAENGKFFNHADLRKFLAVGTDTFRKWVSQWRTAGMMETDSLKPTKQARELMHKEGVGDQR